MEGNPGLLPAEVLLKIFSYCSYRDLVQFQFVCRWWQQVSRHKLLWRDIEYTPEKREKTEDIIENLRASPELRALHLSDVICRNVTKELVVEMSNACPRLGQLSLCWWCFYKKLNFKMEKIKILILYSKEEYFTFASHNFFEHLHKCFPNVKHLDCSDIFLDMRAFAAYLSKKGHSFHSLGFCYDLNHCKDRKLQYLSMCPNLKSLTLSLVCSDFEYLRVESFEHLKQILSLTVQGFGWIDDDTYLSVFRCFPNVVELELHHCTLDKEQELLAIAKNCPLVEKLTLSSWSFSDIELKYVCNFQKLTSLCLKMIHNITDAVVVHLQAISELRYLDISGCCKLTPQCLLAMCSFPKLQTLKFDLRNCDLPAELDASYVKNPDLHIMFYNCKDTSVLDRLRSQRLRISLLENFSSFCSYCE